MKMTVECGCDRLTVSRVYEQTCDGNVVRVFECVCVSQPNLFMEVA